MASVWISRTDAGFMPPGETVPKAKAAALRALELDDTLAEAHDTLGSLRTLYDWDWSGAEKEYQRAIQLNPSYAGAHFAYSDFLITMRRTGEWKAEIQRTLELDPFNFFFQCFYGWHLVYERRYDEAIGQFRKVLATEPDFSSAHMGLWGALYKKGADAEALAEAKKFFGVLGDREVVEALDRGYAEAGYRGAMKLAGTKLAARSERTHVSAVRIARVFAHAGEKERALEWLEKAYGRRETALYHISVGWDWDGLRGDPRFQDLLRRMRLPQ
jgi:tetratricopeptide (TPR) repeat protein